MKILSFNTDKQIQELSQHIESLSKQIYVLDNRVRELEKKVFGLDENILIEGLNTIQLL